MKDLVGTLLRTAPLIHREATPGGVIKRAKYCLRGLVSPRSTSEWFGFLQAPELSYIVENHPCLYHKLQRPYLNCALKIEERLEALKQHYRFILTHFSPPLIEEVYAPAGKLLFDLDVKDFGVIEARLSSSKMQKEGDLTICLTHKPTGRRIASTSFSIWKCRPPAKEMYIGGLQGDKATGEDVVVALTRGLYGMRPKALLVFIVQQLAAGWKISRVHAVSDDLHIYRHFQSRRNVNASYDSFWAECGGTPAADGAFDLPVTFAVREISTIRVNKRQMYKRRYAMLEGIAGQIQSRLSGRKDSYVLVGDVLKAA